MNDQQLENEVVELVGRISPMLAGRQAPVQSAVIADLLARWVLGFHVPGDIEATREVQTTYLNRHLALVTDLINAQGQEIYQGRLKRN